jgi:hypothetical protein
MCQRMTNDGLETILDREEEFRSKPINLLFIPPQAFGKLMLCLPTQSKNATHNDLRSLFRTATQGEPALGFLR